MLVFFFYKYSKFWSISLDKKVDLKPLFSEEWYTKKFFTYVEMQRAYIFFEMVKTCQAPNKVCKNEEAPPRGSPPPQITLGPGGRLDPTLDLLLYYHSLICVLLWCDKTLFKHCTMSQKYYNKYKVWKSWPNFSWYIFLLFSKTSKKKFQYILIF